MRVTQAVVAVALLILHLPAVAVAVAVFHQVAVALAVGKIDLSLHSFRLGRLLTAGLRD